jgi:antitoxin component HigA of HigAB toxin-antitoxin module
MEAYEQEHHAIETADLSPLQVLKYLMNENNLTSGDIGEFIEALQPHPWC